MASSAPDRLDHEVVDVSAPRPSGGNQLAVVLDAGSPTTARCRTPAAESGCAGSTFVSAPPDATAHHPGPGGGPTADHRVRIPTPRTVLPVAGHPGVGPGHTLVRPGRAPVGGPRELAGRVTVAGSAASRVGVAGAARPVAAGTIRVPAC